ncbi:hypothetical protein [Methanosarcina barkeri]|nr:hypothetical protein [Methanosarcina barkeri]
MRTLSPDPIGVTNLFKKGLTENPSNSVVNWLNDCRSTVASDEKR